MYKWLQCRKKCLSLQRQTNKTIGIMETRIGKDYKGKSYKFKTDGEYFSPLCRNTSGIFEGFESSAAAILYTKVVEDRGCHIVNSFGTDVIENYDNGLVGYQCISYYKSLDEAKRDFEGYSKLSPKVGVVAYVDAWLAVNNNKK